MCFINWYNGSRKRRRCFFVFSHIQMRGYFRSGKVRYGLMSAPKGSRPSQVLDISCILQIDGCMYYWTQDEHTDIRTDPYHILIKFFFATAISGYPISAGYPVSGMQPKSIQPNPRLLHCSLDISKVIKQLRF